MMSDFDRYAVTDLCADLLLYHTVPLQIVLRLVYTPKKKVHFIVNIDMCYVK